MNKFFWQLAIKKSQATSPGFTLIELLVTLLITSALVGGSIGGLSIILQSNADNEEETLQQQNTNRALDFMAEEIKSARAIADPTNISTIAPDFPRTCGSGGVECILALDLPEVPQAIVYFTEGASDPWEDPRVIRRWGPNFCEDGTFSKVSALSSAASSTDTVEINPTNCDFDASEVKFATDDTIHTVTSVTPSTVTLEAPVTQNAGTPVGAVDEWSANVLLDQVARGGSHSCGTGTLYGTDGGFYACVEGGRKADLTIELESSDGTYQLEGSAFARSNN